MTRWLVLGAALALLGALLGAVGIVFLGILLALVGWLGTFWSSHGLDGVRYERSMPRDRAICGDELALDLSAWNPKLLPLAWLHIEDTATRGLRVREVETTASTIGSHDVLPTTWTLGSYEQVVRHLHVVADRRGAYRLGPARMEVADLFGRRSAESAVESELGFLVRPRMVPVRFRSAEQWPVGMHRARTGLHQDPSLFAGVRPYHPGDPRSRVHWRATARLGTAVSRRYEPSTLRQVLIALDVQTLEGAHWQMRFEAELLESLMVAAASLARRIIEDGGACGVSAVAWTGRSERMAWVSPAAGEARLAAISDMLARMSTFPSAPFGSLLAELPLRLEPATSVLVVSGRDPAPVLGEEVRVSAAGFPVTHIAMGDAAPEHATAAAAAGVRGMIATLSGGWQASDALELTG